MTSKNIIFQYKHSAIIMEGNKKKSITGKSRHIYISYFFVKDRVDSNDMPIAYFRRHVPVLGEKFCN